MLSYSFLGHALSARCSLIRFHMQLRIVFSGFMCVVFALPLGQVADIAHVGQIKTTKREQKRKGFTVQAQNFSNSTPVAENDSTEIAILNVTAPLVSACEPTFFYHDVAGQVSTPPPRVCA